MRPIRTTFHVVCLTVAIGVAPVTSAATQPSTANDASNHASMWHDRHGGPDGGFHRVLDQLDLTATQMTQIRAIIEQAKPQMQALHESGRANRDQLEVTPPTDAAYAGLLTFAKSNASEQIQLMSDL